MSRWLWLVALWSACGLLGAGCMEIPVCDPSTAACTQPLPPGAPEVQAMFPPLSGSIYVSWTESLPTAELYAIDRQVETGDFLTIKLVRSGIERQFYDCDVRPATRYTYRVTATNQAGATVSLPVFLITPDSFHFGSSVPPVGKSSHLYDPRTIKGVPYVCLPNPNNRADSTGMVSGDTADFTQLDPSKRSLTQLPLSCVWGAASPKRAVFVLDTSDPNIPYPLETTSATDGSGAARVFVTESLGSRWYQVFDAAATLVRLNGPAVQFALLTYDQGSFSYAWPCPPGTSNGLDIPGSCVIPRP